MQMQVLVERKNMCQKTCILGIHVDSKRVVIPHCEGNSLLSLSFWAFLYVRRTGFNLWSCSPLFVIIPAHAGSSRLRVRFLRLVTSDRLADKERCT